MGYEISSSVIYLFFLVEHYNMEEISKLPHQQKFKSATSCAVSTNEDCNSASAFTTLVVGRYKYASLQLLLLLDILKKNICLT